MTLASPKFVMPRLLDVMPGILNVMPGFQDVMPGLTHCCPVNHFT
jgi:hypothetical protein